MYSLNILVHRLPTFPITAEKFENGRETIGKMAFSKGQKFRNEKLDTRLVFYFQ